MSDDQKAAKDPAHVDLETKPVGETERENARQAALGKISRRHAAYMVPAALAVLSSRATAGSP